MKTVSGVLAGKDKHTVCILDDDGTYQKSIKLLGNRVYVVKISQDKNTNGPIILTDRSIKNSNCFLVLAVGTKVQNIEPLQKVGVNNIVWEAEKLDMYSTDERIIPADAVILALEEDKE